MLIIIVIPEGSLEIQLKFSPETSLKASGSLFKQKGFARSK